MSAKIERQHIDRYSNLELLARQVVEGFITGLHKSPFHGFSVEFAEHRLYNTGESTRHIDWKLYGKTEKLFVKRYEEETNLRCQIVIDNSSSMYFPHRDELGFENPNKVLFSVYAAAAILEMLKQQRDAAGLSLFSDKLELHTRARSSTSHIKYLYSELENLLRPYEQDDKRGTFATDSLHQIAEAIHKRSFVVLFTDMFEYNRDAEELFSALQHLKHNKHEVILFHVAHHPEEINFDYDNRPHKFIDMESGDSIRINPHQIKEQYREKLSEFMKELKMKCHQYKIDFIEADIDKGFHQILLPYMLKRERLH